MMTPANRVSSKRYRGAGIASLPPPVRSPPRQASSQTFRALPPRTCPTSSVVRNRCHGCTAPGTSRAAASARLSGSPASRVSARRRSSNTSSPRLETSLSPAASASSTTVQGSRIFPCWKLCLGAVPERQHPRAVAARCRTDLALAAALAQHRGRARSATRRARRGQPGSHAARDGRGSRSLGRAPAAVAGDRGPALERPRDDPAHRLHRAAPRQRAAHVACKLSSRRGRGARSSAQPVTARAAPA